MHRLSPTAEKFIKHWGEMGTKWGINRSVAQVHAILYISDTPLAADQLVDLLGVARSNISTSIKELQSWGLIRTEHVKGDRRDHFVAIGDVWTMFQIIMDERKKREFDPTAALLAECIEESKAEDSTNVRRKLQDLHDFFQTTGKFYHHARALPMPKLLEFMRLGSKLKNLFRS
jgi:DNA-binding transcriptional regulator GbsR (MarR family)